jgi:alkylation response protein AidB-like acyl-CoA dehydrogenase
MDFSLAETQTMLRDGLRRYLDKEYDFQTRRKIVHESGGFLEGHWRFFAEMGLFGASLSEEEGGFGGSLVEAALIAEEMGRALVVEPYLAIAVLAARTLIEAGGEGALERVGQIVAGDGRIVLAHGEDAARGRIAYVDTRARRAGRGWRIDGLKTLVLGAPFAQELIVSARTSGDVSDPEGITLFLVDPESLGVRRDDFRLADGSRASQISFEQVQVANETMIGREGEAFAALSTAHAHAITVLCAEAIGAMDRALWLTRDYLKTREQFGQPIGNFQALQHRMADMLIELELSRSVLFRALANIGSAAPQRNHAVSVAKVQIGKSARFVGSQAIQLHGGIGVTEEYAVGHYFKRLSLIQNLFGTAQAHLSNIVETWDRLPNDRR